MSQSYRGGNSRLIAKSLDQLGYPLAVLDGQGEIQFVNAALCALAKVDATQLVGKHCSWKIAEDDQPLAGLLTALAPPAGALEGRIVTRQLNVPIIYGSSENAQAFIPLLDEESKPGLILVLLGQWSTLSRLIPAVHRDAAILRKSHEEALTQLRSQWKYLDGLIPLVGTSPAIRLAMQRAQLAVNLDQPFVVSGAPGSGRGELIRAIFAGRLKRMHIQRMIAQYFPVDCALLEKDLLAAMLEVFLGRLRSGLHPAAHILVLEQLDQLDIESVDLLNDWLTEHAKRFTVAASCQLGVDELAARNANWRALMSNIGVIPIELPPLADRREDIPVLAQQTVASECAKQGRTQLILSADVLDLLSAYSWPDNWSELERSLIEAVNHAVMTSAIQVSHLPLAIRAFGGSAMTAAATVEPIDLDLVLEEFEKAVIRRAMKLSPRNRARVARWLGISRPRLLRRISQLGLETSDPLTESVDDEDE